MKTILIGLSIAVLAIPSLKQDSLSQFRADIARGGIVGVPCGATFSTQIVIDHPVILRGTGLGSTSPLQEAYTREACTLHCNGTGDAIVIRLPASQFLNGVTLEDFALVADPKANHGSGLTLSGGNYATQIANIFLTRITVKGFPDNGINVVDNVFLVKAWGVSTSRNAKDGWSVTQTKLKGTPSQIRCFDCLSLQNGNDGFNISRSASAAIEFHGVTSANNGRDGIHSEAPIYVFGGSFEANKEYGIYTENNAGVILGACVPLNGHVGVVAPRGTLVQGIPNGLNPKGDVSLR